MTFLKLFVYNIWIEFKQIFVYFLIELIISKMSSNEEICGSDIKKSLITLNALRNKFQLNEEWLKKSTKGLKNQTNG